MANITKVYLLNTPLESDGLHTLWFADRDSQLSYFRSRVKKEYTDFSYQRKDDVIRIPEHIDTLYSLGVNYVMYQNSQYSDKWFYAFVDDMKYINDGVTELKIRTDCIQTWLFELEIKPSFVEREHVVRDIPGENTIDELLDVGEPTVNKRASLSFGKELAVVIGCTSNPDPSVGTLYGGNYGGIYSGMHYIVHDAATPEIVTALLKSFDSAGKGEAIKCMFLAPKHLVAGPDGTVEYGKQPATSEFKTHITEINPVESVGDTQYYRTVNHEFSLPTIDGYEPRNKKLFCYPYRYLMISNNAGGSAIYKFEKFYTPGGFDTKTFLEPTFEIHSVLTPGCSIRLIPRFYNGSERNHEEGLNMGKYPILNWTSDVYTNWLTQNSVNVGVQLATGAAQVVGGAIMTAGTGGAAAAIGVGSIAGGVSSIASTLSSVHQASFMAPQAKGNINSGDVTTSMKENTFQFYTMSVKAEQARILDEFFDMFGYKANRVKVPNTNHRENYWYTKTNGLNAFGKIPDADLKTIKGLYNMGITFWRNSVNFKDYSASNSTTYIGD